MQTRSDQQIQPQAPQYAATATTPPINDVMIAEAENFMNRYLYYQQLKQKEAVRQLRALGANKRDREAEAWEFILSQYQSYQGNFGKVYTNLSDYHKLVLLQTWGFHYCFFKEFQEYHIRITFRGLTDQEPVAPALMRILDNMMIFFCSHIIDYRTTQLVHFSHILPDNQREPTSLNWALQLQSYKEKTKRYAKEQYREAMYCILSHHTIAE